MKSLELELPDRVFSVLDQLVREGFYASAQEAIGCALRDFLRRHAAVLAEKHQREDIAWALAETRKP